MSRACRLHTARCPLQTIESPFSLHMASTQRSTNLELTSIMSRPWSDLLTMHEIPIYGENFDRDMTNTLLDGGWRWGVMERSRTSQHGEATHTYTHSAVTTINKAMSCRRKSSANYDWLAYVSTCLQLNTAPKFDPTADKLPGVPIISSQKRRLLTRNAAKGSITEDSVRIGRTLRGHRRVVVLSMSTKAFFLSTRTTMMCAGTISLPSMHNRPNCNRSALLQSSVSTTYSDLPTAALICPTLLKLLAPAHRAVVPDIGAHPITPSWQVTFLLRGRVIALSGRVNSIDRYGNSNHCVDDCID